MTSAYAAADLDGLRVFRSPLLDRHGIAHGFTTRLGGASDGPFASLNLGFATGDQADRVAANRARLCAAFGLEPAALRMVRQVHGDALVDAAALPPADVGCAVQADGLYTSSAGLLLGVRVADCLPVLLASRDGAWVAAVHAGWRGLAAGILSQAVAALAEGSRRPAADLLAAVGPGIGQERYEVSAEVAGGFPPECQRTGERGRPLLDLAAVAVRQLREAGIGDVDASGRCTHAEAEWFYSHRRDGPRTGRQAGVIVAHRQT
ncbi:MAG: peptidoglycan editing factor PgeF [Armatimonadetes bacterium]|nr:peptidoglycan editing factor PgeF [Armatimonadota bacterium]